jgi:hypothetical protein
VTVAASKKEMEAAYSLCRACNILDSTVKTRGARIGRPPEIVPTVR